MKTIIAGGRNITKYSYVEAAVKESGFNITEVVSGCARGADTLGENWANKHNIPIKKFPADWDNLGKKAGHVRNCQMGDYADALIAIWDGQSRGTKHMIDYATKKGLEVFIYYYKGENMSKFHLYQGDCLEIMKDIPDGSVDMILTDLPYGTTACKWDSIIPFEPLWEQYKRVIKTNAAIVLFASQPFTSKLITSNFNMYKYSLIWKKNTSTGFMQAKTRPLKSYEDILVFGDFKLAAQYFKGTYNPQGIVPVGKVQYSNKRKEDHITGNRKPNTSDSNRGYPKDILEFNSEINTIHPTQKPVELLKYLIKTYTNDGETVLDNTMGSGSTGVACANTNRNFIGIELDEGYFNIAKERIETAYQKEINIEE